MLPCEACSALVLCRLWGFHFLPVLFSSSLALAGHHKTQQGCSSPTYSRSTASSGCNCPAFMCKSGGFACCYLKSSMVYLYKLWAKEGLYWVIAGPEADDCGRGWVSAVSSVIYFLLRFCSFSFTLWMFVMMRAGPASTKLRMFLLRKSLFLPS